VYEWAIECEWSSAWTVAKNATTRNNFRPALTMPDIPPRRRIVWDSAFPPKQNDAVPSLRAGLRDERQHADNASLMERYLRDE
jgi:hypothetical protein